MSFSGKQFATVAASVSTVKKAFDEYRDKIKELFDEKGLRKIDEKKEIEVAPRIR